MKALSVDGKFGPNTKKRMQKWLGVSQDGKIGKNTIKHLQKRVGASQDGKWGPNTTKRLQRFLNGKGAHLSVDGKFGKNTIKALQTYLNQYYGLNPQPQPTPTPTPTPTPSTNAQKIVAMAQACAWPAGTSSSKYKYPGGKPTAAYKEALNKAYPNRSKWSDRPKKGVSCDVFVGTVLRASGVDPKWPRGLDGVRKYAASSSYMYLAQCKSTKNLQPGDVIFYLKKGGGGHIAIYLGNGKIANAHYVGKTYGRIQNFSTLRKPSECKIYNVYRAK